MRRSVGRMELCIKVESGKKIYHGEQDSAFVSGAKSHFGECYIKIPAAGLACSTASGIYALSIHVVWIPFPVNFVKNCSGTGNSSNSILSLGTSKLTSEDLAVIMLANLESLLR